MKYFETISELIEAYKEEGLDINEMKKVALYMRYSSKNQTEDSIEYQRRKILEFCYKNHLLPIEEYIDEAYSGKTDKRPEFLRMLKDSQNNPEWGEILVFNLSRFCRNAWLGIKSFKDIRTQGLEITSVVENFPKTPEGRFMESFYHLFNEYSSEINATHTRESMINNALKGQHCGGIPPLGYDVDNVTKEYVINEVEAQAVKMIFDLYEKNVSYQMMADKLNEEGYKTKKGDSFTKNSFDSILNQEKYTGTYVWNASYAKSVNGKRNNRGKKADSEQIVVKDKIPVIISKTQFDRVQDMMKSGRRMTKGIRSKKHYMLGGLGILKCKECGSNMHAETTWSHGKSYEIYVCPNHKKGLCSMKYIRADSLHDFVADALVEEVKSRKDLDTVFSKFNKENRELTILRNRLTGTETAIKRVSYLYQNNPDETIKKSLDKLVAEKKMLEARIKKAAKPANMINKGNLNNISKKLKKTLIESEKLEIRNYIKDSIEEIIADKNEVMIKLKID